MPRVPVFLHEKGGCRIIPNSRLSLVSLKCVCLLTEGNVLLYLRFTLSCKEICNGF